MTDKKETPKPTLVEILRTPVAPEYISERKGLSYVTGRYVKQMLNELFGPLGWSYEVLESHRVDAESTQVARWYVHLQLSVTVGERTVRRDGIAIGHGLLEGRNGPVTPGRANEVLDFAAAEAVTDALKRAAVSLGQVFGLSLYPLGPDEPTQTKAAPKAATKTETKTKKRSGFKSPKSF